MGEVGFTMQIMLVKFFCSFEGIGIDELVPLLLYFLYALLLFLFDEFTMSFLFLFIVGHADLNYTEIKGGNFNNKFFYIGGKNESFSICFLCI